MSEKQTESFEDFFKEEEARKKRESNFDQEAYEKAIKEANELYWNSNEKTPEKQDLTLQMQEWFNITIEDQLLTISKLTEIYKNSNDQNEKNITINKIFDELEDVYYIHWLDKYWQLTSTIISTIWVSDINFKDNIKERLINILSIEELKNCENNDLFCDIKKFIDSIK